jgi:hypothetical protein
MKTTERDIVEQLRAECLESTAGQPEGRIEHDIRWRAAREIERLRAFSTGWQPIDTAPRDNVPVLLYCPGLKGNAASEIVVGAWRFDANRRTFGYWVSDVGALDSGFSETGPWIEYKELHPRAWAPLPGPPPP